ncbi:hypothetical protein [Micromonospora pallida]|uniref:hypothetical protein n=1 Tax=Micromonospora pallida TaxID=145854 RepID=UPI00159EFD5E|nr:hypothetical protein [Micromonospora pallida]
MPDARPDRRRWREIVIAAGAAAPRTARARGCQWATDEEQIAAAWSRCTATCACLPARIVEREQERAAADQKSRCNCFLCNPAIRATWPPRCRRSVPW